MALLRPSVILARCDICRLPFDPVFGGICPQCGKLLCSTHLFGNPLVKLAAYM